MCQVACRQSPPPRGRQRPQGGQTAWRQQPVLLDAGAVHADPMRRCATSECTGGGRGDGLANPPHVPLSSPSLTQSWEKRVALHLQARGHGDAVARLLRWQPAEGCCCSKVSDLWSDLGTLADAGAADTAPHAHALLRRSRRVVAPSCTAPQPKARLSSAVAHSARCSLRRTVKCPLNQSRRHASRRRELRRRAASQVCTAAECPAPIPPRRRLVVNRGPVAPDRKRGHSPRASGADTPTGA